MEQNKNNNVASTLARQGMKQVSKKIGLALKIKIGVVIGLITLVGLLVIGSLATLQEHKLQLIQEVQKSLVATNRCHLKFKNGKKR